MSKFVIRPIGKLNCDPVTSIFKPGIPFGMQYFKGDLILFHPEITTSKTFLNSKILREAILNSKEYVEEALGLIISDALNVEEVKEEAPKKETKAKRNSKKVEEPKEVTEVTIENNDKVSEGEEVKEDNSLILEEEPLVTEE